MTDLRIHSETSLNFHIVIDNLKAATRKQVMRTLADRVAAFGTLNAQTLFDLLMDRERLATSGIGNGVSIPHLRLPDLPDRFYGLVRLAQPVDFMAMDARPVDLIAFVLSPTSDGMKHLSRLSRLSRLMRDENLLTRLRRAENADTMQAVLLAHPARQQLLAAA